MSRHIIERLVWAIVVIFLLTTITFAILYIVPSDPARAVAGGQASPEAVANIRKQLGLDEPLYAQYWHYVSRLPRGDLGYSYHSRESVAALVSSRLAATLLLAVSGIVVSVAIGLTLGFIAATKAGSLVDRAIMVSASVFVSMPQFWIGIVLLYYLAARWGVVPIGGYGSPSQLLLPALTLGLAGFPWYTQVFRASMIEALGAEYTRTAQAKGLARRRVLMRHVAPNATTAVVTLIGLDLAYYMGGVVVVETVFGWPGIGQLAWQAIGNHDLPVIMGTVLVSAVAVVAANLLIDIAYTFVDPRIRYS
jgi:peptide/nickel transport system permease protein